MTLDRVLDPLSFDHLHSYNNNSNLPQKPLHGCYTMVLILGFSFGGMLACYVAANLWKTSFISGDVLEKNVVCITFGQPLIPIPYVEEAIRDFPQFEATIHAVYDKDDFFPRVLYYFNVGCKHYYDTNQAIKSFSQTQAASLLASNTMV